MSESTQHDRSKPPKRWIVMGVSGCGKSEIGRLLGERLGFTHVEGDEHHPQANIDKMAAGQPLDDHDRQGWLLILQQQIREAVDRDAGLVLSCSALKRRYRDLLRGGDPDLYFVHLDGDRELIAQRMQARADHFMPVTLLDSQFRDLEPLQADEAGMRADIRLPPDELVDGVLARFDFEDAKDKT